MMWYRITIPRAPVAFWVTAFGVCTLHGYLCNGAITCRGFPPLKPNDIIYCFVAPLFVGLPALLDDRRTTRDRGVVMQSLGLGFVYGVAKFNLSWPIPAPGAHAGFWGLIANWWYEIPFHAIIPTLIVFTLVYFWERVSGDLWDYCRRFSQTSQATPKTE